MRTPPREEQLPLPIVEEIRTRKGSVLYFGDEFSRLLRARRKSVKPSRDR